MTLILPSVNIFLTSCHNMETLINMTFQAQHFDTEIESYDF